MTVYAIAKIESIDVDLGAGNYLIYASYVVTDGANKFATEVLSQISFTLGSRRLNRLIRERIATVILANHSLTIDPEDIYIPLSS